MTKIRVKDSTVIYQGRVIRLIRETLEVRGHRIVRETIQHPGAVVVVPMLDHSRIVFVRQYRRAVGRFLLELPAGTLELGERRDLCAKRELEEETGWKAKHLTRLGQFYAAPGFVSEQMTIFLATGLTPVPPRPEPDEMVTPVILSLREALQRIRTGSICDAKTIIGVLFTAARGNGPRPQPPT
ncbi:MAG: NUDIX hydrolase [Candidatus Omnitrophica bacterium]|nr:NUDIX hydrolase [Candidatus Omnitrophota bacterium]